MKTLFATLISLLILGAGSAATQAQEPKAGDPVAGQKKNDMCVGCHGIPGYKASFPEIYRVPKISGQNASYIVTALTEYKKGDRKHPSMRSIATTLTEQDMADLAAYYAQHGKDASAAPPETPTAPSPEVAALLQKGNCSSCHGANFAKPIDAGYPKLAGQHPDYLYVALKAYQTSNGERIGRNNAIMMGMAKPYTHAELKKIAAYIASLPGGLKTIEEPHFRFLP